MIQNNEYGLNFSFQFVDEKAQKQIDDLTRAVEHLDQELQTAQRDAEAANTELAALQDKYDAFARSNGIDVLENKLHSLQQTASQSAEEFRTFLRSVNVDDGDDRFEKWIDQIEDGVLTCNQAITQFKMEHASLLQDVYANSGASADNQMFATLISSLERMGNVLDSVAAKTEQILAGDIPTIRDGIGNGAFNTTKALQDIQVAMNATGEDAEAAYAPMMQLLTAITDYANVDDTKLYRVSEAFRNMAAMGEGRFGTKSVDNIIRLVEELQRVSKNGDGVARFNLEGFSNLKVSKASLENLATYLPQLAKVNVEKLRELSTIDLSNFNNISVSKGVLQGLSDFVNSLSKIKEITKSAGGGSRSSANELTIDGQSLDVKQRIKDIKEYYSVMSQIRREATRLGGDITFDAEDNPIFGTGDFATNLQAQYDRVSAAFREAESLVQQSGQGLFQDYPQEVQNALAQIEQAYEQFSTADQMAGLKAMRTASNSWTNLTQKAIQFYRDNINVAGEQSYEVLQNLERIRELALSGDPTQGEALKQAMGDTAKQIEGLEAGTEKWWQKFKKTFGTRLRSALAGFITGKLAMAIRNVYTNVVSIDSAMTQLRIVTGATDSQMTKFWTKSINLSKSLGASVNDVLKSIETFSRLGYDLNESSVLAKYSTILSKVAGVQGDDSTKGLTSIIKGYGFDPSDAQHIADVLVTVGQKYAVSASELMEAFSRSGAALNATNTSFEKSAGLIAAANASIQDASTVGTALKTVSARIRKSKADLDDLGESADDLAKSWSTYAKEIQALTGVNIMIEGSETQFKDLYDIFSELAAVWNDLGEEADTTRARVAEILGGTRQYQIISSILSNWGDAAGAYSDALASAGSSTKAMDTYLDSIEGKIAQLQSTYAELSNNILSSDLVKVGAEMLRNLTALINDIVGLTKNAFKLRTAILGIATILLLLESHRIADKIQQTTDGVIGFVKALSAATKAGSDFGAATNQAYGKLFGEGKLGKVLGVATAITAVATAISAVVALIQNAIREQEELRKEQIKTLTQSSQASVEASKEAEDTIAKLKELHKQYKELGNAQGAVWSKEQIQSVQDIQDQIVELVGDQAAQLDLVNGKLSTEYALLTDIEQKQQRISFEQAEAALGAAKGAIRTALIGGDSTGMLDFYMPSTGTLSERFVAAYEKMQEERQRLARAAANSADPDVMDFAAMQTRKFADAQMAGLANAISEYEDLYNAYISAREAVDRFKNESTSEAPGAGTTYLVKSVDDILKEIQDNYDVIVASMEDMDEHGTLTVKTFQDMVSNNLSDYLTQTADGFVLNEGALEDYIDTLINGYMPAEEDLTKVSEDQLDATRSNLDNLRTALAMLALSTDKVKEALEAQKQAYKDQEDALNDQLDKYKELIDLRKELLEQYKDELDYKKELEKKEKKVASLQTQLTVAQLDNSAAGRARARQIAADLEEAQEELDDFTLEHAIEVVTNELDSQYEEYQKLIDAQLDEIEKRIEALSGSASLADVADGITNLAERVDDIINAMPAPRNKDEVIQRAQEYINSHHMLEADRARWGQDSEFLALLREVQAVGGSASDLIGWDASLKNAIQDAQYYIDSHHMLESDRSRWGQDKDFLTLFRAMQALGGSTSDLVGWNQQRAQTLHSSQTVTAIQSAAGVQTFDLTSVIPSIVQNALNAVTARDSSPEPQNIFNAPLMSIICDNVTENAVPKLKDVVNETVNKIKQELDRGLMRTGYQKSVQKIVF